MVDTTYEIFFDSPPFPSKRKDYDNAFLVLSKEGLSYLKAYFNSYRSLFTIIIIKNDSFINVKLKDFLNSIM
jgi:hypothetical protein